MFPHIDSPTSPALGRLVDELFELAPTLDAHPVWPARQLQRCAEAGVFEWFIGREYGGQGWDDVQVTHGYLALSKACLTTTFVITQRTAACTRIENSTNELLKRARLPSLAHTATFATVAISHLSTSRRHLQRPILRAVAAGSGYELDGYSAWVTGATEADTIVTGATLEDGRQILVAVPTDTPGLIADPPEALVGLTGSCTGRVRYEHVVVDAAWVLSHDAAAAGQTSRSSTGGLQTSTLAVGAADAALDYLESESAQRSNLRSVTKVLRDEWTALRDDLLSAAAGQHSCSLESIRTRANSLVLRTTQAALVAAKGTGYVVGHPAGRRCREALFFLVWSCPQPVTDANLCELAGLRGTHDD